jgi:hypothetical protein
MSVTTENKKGENEGETFVETALKLSGKSAEEARTTGAIDRADEQVEKLFATKYQESNIFLSNQVNSQSRILYDRDPKTRVEKVAPWLTLDGDPYPTIVNGKILWVVDGYTTTNGYPYSTRSSLDDVTTDSQSSSATALVTSRPRPTTWPSRASSPRSRRTRCARAARACASCATPTATASN